MKAHDGQRETRKNRRISCFSQRTSSGASTNRSSLGFSKRSSASSACSALFVVVATLLLVPTTSVAGAQQQALSPPGDPAAVERGQRLHVQECGFCHGANARGGSSGPDLTRSALVQSDENGRQLGEFLQAGRPDRGMPRFDLPAAQVADLAAFLHSAIYLNSNRRLYKILDILVGDPRAGEAYFAGAGRCSACHSAAGDLKGVGARYDPVALQQRLLMPRGSAVPPGASPVPLYAQPTAIRATVTTRSGELATGGLVRMTDFDITIYNPATGSMRSWLRNGDDPKVVLTDPLQAHVDHLTKWTDADMHNMTAYLASLK
jgi:cytochrome c oxidase cbb3-type subunit III